MINFWNGYPINVCVSHANTVADGQQIPVEAYKRRRERWCKPF